MPSRGRRIRVTARLPYDEFREASIRQQRLGWSMSDFIAYCVRRELGRQDPHSRPVVHVVDEQVFEKELFADG